jgi:hypothetical protein
MQDRRLRSLSTILWARVLNAFGTSRLAVGRRLVLVLQSFEGRGGDGAQIVHHVSLFDGRLKMLREVVGPSFYAFDVCEYERANLH